MRRSLAILYDYPSSSVQRGCCFEAAQFHTLLEKCDLARRMASRCHLLNYTSAMAMAMRRRRRASTEARDEATCEVVCLPLTEITAISTAYRDLGTHVISSLPSDFPRNERRQRSLYFISITGSPPSHRVHVYPVL